MIGSPWQGWLCRPVRAQEMLVGIGVPGLTPRAIIWITPSGFADFAPKRAPSPLAHHWPSASVPGLTCPWSPRHDHAPHVQGHVQHDGL